MNIIKSNSNLISKSNNNSNNDMQANILNEKAAYMLNSEFNGNKENDKVAYYLGDGWCTFPDLDNFDSDKLLKALTLKEKDSVDSIWDPSLSYTESSQRKQSQHLSVSSLRQLEALFNLTQLLFGLSRAETVNYTFRDLQLRKHPHSFKKSGFKHLNSDGRIDFYAIFELLVKNIIEQGGLEVALLMYRNPVLPMVRQKCLDLISNVATVPEIAYKIMLYQSWFMDHLLIMIRDGDIVSDKIPALSVLIRLLKVMLTERMMTSYMKLVDMQYIDCLVDIFENPKYTDSSEFLPFFIKFEFITMQSLTVILGDIEYSQYWSDKAKIRLLNYCMIVLLKAAGAYLSGNSNQSNLSINSNTTTNTNNTINHIFYAEQHTNKHSLAHTIMTVTELLRNDENMKLFYRYHKPFKQLIIQLYKKYGAKSQFSRIDPGISYALNHLMRVLYIKSSSSVGAQSTQLSSNQLTINNNNNQAAEQVGQVRVCSNPDCKNEETKYKEFKNCPDCEGKLAAYCSRKCRKVHLAHHRKYECINISCEQHSLTRRASENFHNKRELSKKLSLNIHDDDYLIQTGDSVHQSLSRTKRLSKYSSMNENHRRSSLNFVRNGSCNFNLQPSKSNLPKPPHQHYTKHTSSMKEIKSSRIYEDNLKLKIFNSKNNHQTNENSINFVRPLKTSTALCLTDLTRKQSKQISAISNSTSSSSSSTENSLPTKKKFKTNNGSQELKEKSKIYENMNANDYQENNFYENFNPQSSSNRSTHKRRHSTTASILTTTTTTTTTKTTKTKIKEKAEEENVNCQNDVNTNQKYFYRKKDDLNNEDIHEGKNVLNGDFEDDEINEFLSTSSSSKSGSDTDSPLSDSMSSNEETIEKISDQEEVEGERWATRNDLRTRGSNHKVESPESSDLFSSANETSINSLENSNQDELERKSQFKVIKELEKTIEFVKNASNLKVMSLNHNNENDSKQESLKKQSYMNVHLMNESQNLKAPHISLASLCYDRNNTTSKTDYDENSSDDDISENGNKSVRKPQNPKGVNLIINNSIDSQMLTNSFNMKSQSKTKSETANNRHEDDDFIDDEMSMFKNDTLNTNKPSDYKTFKIPLLPTLSSSTNQNLPLSLQPIQIQSNEYLLKNNKIYNELKVFNNISNLEQTTNTININFSAPTELPKNSTPIFGDNTTAAYLTAKRKQLINAKLDLTIAPLSQQEQTTQQQQISNKPIERKSSNFLVPKIAQLGNRLSFEKAGQDKEKDQPFITSTLRSTNNLQTNINKSDGRSSKILTVPVTGSLDLSKLSAIENVVTSTNLVCVTKAEIPKDIKRSLKDEIKKDKTKCIIQ